MIKKILKTKFLFLVIFLTLLISGVNICVLYLSLPSSLSETKIIIIPKKPIKEITDLLAKNEVIKYPQLFLLLSKLYSLYIPLKSGEYKFTSKISPLQVLKILSTGKSIIHKLVIPEGVTVHEIIQKIIAEERLFGEVTSKIPEGFLMPSTYFFSYGDHKEQIIDQMRNNMSAQLDIIMKELTQDSLLKTRIEVLTLASIVEKEAQLDSERPMIAAVFLNRLKKNMKLQADPTTIYAITEGKFKLARPLTKKDLLIESPYNTYHVFNLPPSPISCPGVKSLQAVVRPAKTTALYFVVNSGGGHSFADNLNEHNINVKNYRKSKELSKETQIKPKF